MKQANSERESYRDGVVLKIRGLARDESQEVRSSLERLAYYLSLLDLNDDFYTEDRVVSVSETVAQNQESYESPAIAIIESQTTDRELQGDIVYVSAERSVNLRTTPILSELNILRTLERNASLILLEQYGEWSLVKDQNGE